MCINIGSFQEKKEDPGRCGPGRVPGESPGQLCGREPGPCEVGKYSKTTQVVFESSIPIDREILKS